MVNGYPANRLAELPLELEAGCQRLIQYADAPLTMELRLGHAVHRALTYMEEMAWLGVEGAEDSLFPGESDLSC
jgi:hypothetical protein